MITAGNDAAARIAVQGIRGSVRRLLEPLIEDVLNIIAQIEVNIDYPEYEDVEQLTTGTLLPEIRSWIARIEQILDRAACGQQVKKGWIPLFWDAPTRGKAVCSMLCWKKTKPLSRTFPARPGMWWKAGWCWMAFSSICWIPPGSGKPGMKSKRSVSAAPGGSPPGRSGDSGPGPADAGNRRGPPAPGTDR